MNQKGHLRDRLTIPSTDESTYKRDLVKRIELINWVLENMKNPDIFICDKIESRMSEIIVSINKTHSILEADKNNLSDRGRPLLKKKFYCFCNNHIFISITKNESSKRIFT
jgi:hypothetical protein